MDILPIQASSVPCERVFFSSKETCTARCSRTTPTLMEALQLLKYHLKHGRPLDFTEGTCKEDELREMEIDATLAVAILDNLDSFIHTLLPLL